ncbi:MAG: hypothetical protein K6T83_03635 [Alicyclobacillus sp.]|nr:hypothetical protein [Alicyclobacillus sp.]
MNRQLNQVVKRIRSGFCAALSRFVGQRNTSDVEKEIDIGGHSLTPKMLDEYIEQMTNDEPRIIPTTAFVNPRVAYAMNHPRVQETLRWSYPPERRMRSHKWYSRRNKTLIRMKAKANVILQDAYAEYDRLQENTVTVQFIETMKAIEGALVGDVQ